MGKLAEGFETDRWHGRRSIGAGCGVKRGGSTAAAGSIIVVIGGLSSTRSLPILSSFFSITFHFARRGLVRGGRET
jgi:hypothetical protein